MRPLGLELSDAGIMVASAESRQLIAVDGEATESPGIALAEKKQLLVGVTAARKTHLFPHLVDSRFWDQLNIDSRNRTQPYLKQTRAEMVYAHLSRIWEKIQAYGDAVIVALPGFYTQEQLGLLLGIANEASLPIKGFLPLALAAAETPCPQRMLVHVDIHLHRAEIIFLTQANTLSMEESVSIPEKGLLSLHRAFVETMASEFVRTTRFDPLHQAAYEQELYDRLPAILKKFKTSSTVDLEIKGDSGSFSAALARELFVEQTTPLFAEIDRIIAARMKRQVGLDHPLTLQISHRLAHLPGWREGFTHCQDARLIKLHRGAGAFGALRLGNQLPIADPEAGVSFLTSRPWDTASGADLDPLSKGVPADHIPSHPTHILYRNLAYRLTETPLVIGLEIAPAERGIRIQRHDTSVSPRHCSIQRRGSAVVLINLSAAETFVDETPVHGSTTLEIGQVIRIGSSGETLSLIAAVETNAA